MTLLKPKIFLLLIFPLALFLSFNKHSKDKINTYHGVIWADAAGYYVYQPIWFIYGNNASKFPIGIGDKTGNGFQLDSINNRVATKYPSGSAILQTPFFLTCHLLAKPLGYEADGFSKIYSFGLYFSGIFYCCIGLFLLSKFLALHFRPLISFISPLLFFAGSNLYYYSIDMPGMSHVYSFFLFSSIIYLTPYITSKSNFNYYLLFYCCIILVLLTRPTNILLGLFPFFYNIKSKVDFFARIRFLFFNKLKITIAVLLAFLLAIPQFLYWHKTTGHFITYSYGNESFSFWKNPQLVEVWFSTNNGLFTYTPLVIGSIIGIFVMIKHIKWEGLFIGFLFLLISYIFASWWNWWFGCAFGARSFVEYYALLIIPFAYLLEYTFRHKSYKYAMILFIGFCCFLNMDIEYYYDGCFHGDVWDLTSYLKLL